MMGFASAQDASAFGLTDLARYSAPTFADLDGDGDLDALVGEKDGNLLFFENEPPPGVTISQTNGSTQVNGGSAELVCRHQRECRFNGVLESAKTSSVAHRVCYNAADVGSAVCHTDAGQFPIRHTKLGSSRMKIQDLLAKLKPLDELDTNARNSLVETLSISDLAQGSRLVSKEEAEFLVYLVLGKLRVRDTNEGRELGVLQGATPRALRPLFVDQTNYLAVAEAPCKLLRIPRKAVEAATQAQLSAAYEVSEVQVDEQESALFQAIYLASSNHELQLPSMPEVAMKIRQMANNPDVGVEDLSKVIQTDPTVAGRILHASNSALYRGRQEITGVRDALVRLGLKTTQSLAMSIAMGQTFRAKSTTVKQLMQHLWNHSVRISALASVIARKIGGGLNPETALLAGLLHDVGAIPILSFVDNRDEAVDPNDLQTTINKLRAMTGLLVMEYWGFSKEFIDVVEGAENWQRDTGNPCDYTDLVIIAQLYDNMQSGQDPAIPSPETTPAFKKLTFGGQTDEDTLQVLREADGEVAATMALLA